MVQTSIQPQRDPDGVSDEWSLVPASVSLIWARRSATARPRLRERIDRGVRGKLTLLAAPAGWGKTTLLGEWTARTELPVAWVALQEADDDPLRFWRRVVAALGRLRPGLADDALALFQTPQPPPLAQVVEAALDAAASLPWDAVLILEDLHLIRSAETYETLDRFVDAMPPTLHLVVATRHDPPLRLSRLRAQGELVELRADDLRFDGEEARHFFAAVPGVALRDDEVAALVERTEGWVAGLRLAALSLEGRADPREVIAGFGGIQLDIADYLTEEVLARQAEPVVSFRLQTSILDRLTAPLCDAVTGRGDGQEMLERLERHNLFLLPLDDHRGWYRYHGLFAELLRSRLRRDAPDREAALHRRAAAWYEEHGLPLDAVRHAVLAEDTAEAAAVLERAADRLLWTRGEVTAFLRWVDALPVEVREARPRLMRSRAWALTLAGRLAEAEDAIAEIERRLETGSPAENDATPEPPDDPDGLNVLRGEAKAIRSRIAAFRSDHETATRCARHALALVPPSHGRLRSDVALNLGYTYLILGRLREAKPPFEEAVATGWASGNARAALFGLFYLAQVRLVEGRLREARTLLADELERAERGTSGVGWAVAVLRLGLGEILYEQNELEEARRQLELAVDEGRRAGDAKTLIYAYVLLSRVYQAMGEGARATATLRRGAMLSGSPWSGMDQARLALTQGDLRAAERWVTEAGLAIDDDPAPGDEVHYATFARLLIARGRLDEAIAVLERRLAAAEAGGRDGRALGFLALLAVARHAAGDRPAAIALVARALSLAADEAYVRTFVDLGPPMAELLRAALRAARRADDGLAALPVAYAQGLLAAFAEPGEGRADPTAVPGLVEPLTERELQILELVAAGRSNQEIAAALYLAPGTVKAHLNHIYGKLPARNRTEAIASARRLGLLSS